MAELVTADNAGQVAARAGGFGDYRKKQPTRAVRMSEPFVCDTGHGPARGEAGDWLAVDGRGLPYPIEATEFDRTYEAIDAPRDPAPAYDEGVDLWLASPPMPVTEPIRMPVNVLPHDHSGFAEYGCQACEQAADEAYDAAVTLIEERGYQVVKPCIPISCQPETVTVSAVTEYREDCPVCNPRPTAEIVPDFGLLTTDERGATPPFSRDV